MLTVNFCYKVEEKFNKYRRGLICCNVLNVPKVTVSDFKLSYKETLKIPQYVSLSSFSYFWVLTDGQGLNMSASLDTSHNQKCEDSYQFYVACITKVGATVSKRTDREYHCVSIFV